MTHDELKQMSKELFDKSSKEMRKEALALIEYTQEHLGKETAAVVSSYLRIVSTVSQMYVTSMTTSLILSKIVEGDSSKFADNAADALKRALDKLDASHYDAVTDSLLLHLLSNYRHKPDAALSVYLKFTDFAKSERERLVDTIAGGFDMVQKRREERDGQSSAS